MEPINTRDIPGFFLNRQDQAHEMVQEIGAANLKVQMDLYHCQIVEGDLAMKIRQYLPTGRVGHFQMAGVPERHEPDMGEINYAYLFERDRRGVAAMRLVRLDRLRVQAAPRRAPGGTSAGLGWFSLALKKGETPCLRSSFECHCGAGPSPHKRHWISPRG